MREPCTRTQSVLSKSQYVWLDLDPFCCAIPPTSGLHYLALWMQRRCQQPICVASIYSCHADAELISSFGAWSTVVQSAINRSKLQLTSGQASQLHLGAGGASARIYLADELCSSSLPRATRMELLSLDICRLYLAIAQVYFCQIIKWLWSS